MREHYKQVTSASCLCRYIDQNLKTNAAKMHRIIILAFTKRFSCCVSLVITYFRYCWDGEGVVLSKANVGIKADYIQVLVFHAFTIIFISLKKTKRPKAELFNLFVSRINESSNDRATIAYTPSVEVEMAA